MLPYITPILKSKFNGDWEACGIFRPVCLIAQDFKQLQRIRPSREFVHKSLVPPWVPFIKVTCGLGFILKEGVDMREW